MNEENHETPEEEKPAEFVAELIEGDEVVDGPAAAAVASFAPRAVAYDPSVSVPMQKSYAPKPPPSAFENLAAKGGAIGAIVLGVLSFVGSFITSYAILNSFMGILLGLWGMRSDHQKLAMIGMLLCLISAFFCVVEISDWIQTIWPQEEF